MEGKNKTRDASFKESQERYRAFLRNSQEGIWRIELDEPIPIDLPVKKQIKLMYKYAWMAEANLAMAKMYGYRSVKPLIGVRLGDLLLEDDPSNIAYLTAFIKNSYKLSGVESHEKDRHGKDRYFRNSLVGIVENNCVIRAWGTQQDVTEHHAVMADRAKSDIRLKLALQATDMGIWEWDVKTGDLHWSNELKKIFGLPPETNITYNKYLSKIHFEDKKMMQDTIKKALESGVSYKVEHRVIYPDGSVHWILGQGKAFKENGKVSYMMGTSMLIDDRKQFEAKIIESEARFRSMADTAPVMIWVSDAKGNITYINKPFLEFSGRKLKDKKDSGWHKDVHPDDIQRVMESVAMAYQKHDSYSMEYRTRSADGTYRWVLTKAIPRYAQDKSFLGYIGSSVDIEEVKSAILRSAELESSNAQLVSINNAKDEFISIASHQLRTPATGVKQYVGMVLEGFAGALNKDQYEMLQLAYLSNERQINIINDLLRVAQIDAGKVEIRPKKCDIVALIKDIIKEQESKFSNREQSISLIAPARVVVPVDQRLIRMVIENLLDNAGKYSSVQSTIQIKVRQFTHEACVSIKDSGVGIDAKDMANLFQKFHRIQTHLTAGVEGSGLGLYWSKSIVDLHGGNIQVKSKPNNGSTFTLHLPLKKAKVKNPPAKLLKKQG